LRVPDSPMQSFLNALDARDLEAAAGLFTQDATLTTTFGDTATGRDQVRGELAGLFGELRAMKHHVTAQWNPEPGVWIAEMSASYELSDYSERGPYERVIIIRSGDGGVQELRIYGSHELPLSQDGGGYRDVRGPHGWLPTL
jgi:hypothetical protein